MAHLIRSKGKSTATERRMLAYLETHLPAGWYVLGNINVWDGRQNRELDAIVIGPNYVWAIDEKSWRQVAKGDHSHWWLPAVHGMPEKKVRSPIEKQQDTARILKGFIEKTCPNVWVEALVILSGKPDLSTVDDPGLTRFTKSLEGSEDYFIAPGKLTPSGWVPELRPEQRIALIGRLLGEATAKEALEALGIEHEVTHLGCPVCDTRLEISEVTCPKCEWQISRLLNIPSDDEIQRHQEAVLAHRKQWEEKQAAASDPLYQLRTAAEQGDTTAQAKLWEMFEDVFYSETDDTKLAEAETWLRNAAEQGGADAQNRLGEIFDYDDGPEVATHNAEAVKWYSKAAEQGYAPAQYNLGYAYWEGRGVAKDLAEAVKYYRKAAEKGDGDAQNNLGYAYWAGEGVEEDHAEAMKWFRMAAEQGHQEASDSLSVLRKDEEATARLAEENRRKAALEAERNSKAEQKKQELASKHADEEARWGSAVAAGTIDSFRNYMLKSELATHVPEAMQRIGALAKQLEEEAERDRQAEQKRQEDAREQSDEERSWQSALSYSSISAFEWFLKRYLEETKLRLHVREANEALENIYWQEALRYPSTESFDVYLEKSVLLTHEQEARKRIETIKNTKWQRLGLHSLIVGCISVFGWLTIYTIGNPVPTRSAAGWLIGGLMAGAYFVYECIPMEKKGRASSSMLFTLCGALSGAFVAIKFFPWELKTNAFSANFLSPLWMLDLLSLWVVIPLILGACFAWFIFVCGLLLCLDGMGKVLGIRLLD